MKPFVPEGAPVAATIGTSTASIADGASGVFNWRTSTIPVALRAPTHISLQNNTGAPVYFKFNSTSISTDVGGEAQENDGVLADGETRSFPVVGIIRVAVAPVGATLYNVGDGAGNDKNFWCLGWFRTAQV